MSPLLQHNMKRLGLSMPRKFEKLKSFREPPIVRSPVKDKPRLPPRTSHPRPPSWVVKRTFKELGAVSAVAVAPRYGGEQSRYLAVGRDDEHIAIWDLNNKQRIAK